MMIALAAIGAYVLLVGVASFLERPVGKGFDALQLNALIRIGSAALGIVALLAAHGVSLPPTPSLLAGLGIGVLAGAGSICYCLALNYLPVSVVVSLANLYIVITVLLGVAFLHENITLLKIVSGPNGHWSTAPDPRTGAHEPMRLSVRFSGRIGSGPSGFWGCM